MATDLSSALREEMGDETFSTAMIRFADAFTAYRERLPRIPHAYSRTRLAATPAYEIVAMSWAPKSMSPIHDHGSSRCWVLMLEGKLDVENFVCTQTTPALVRPPEIRAAERILLGPGELDRRFGPTELHRVGNPDPNAYAYSLQLYAAPLTTYAIVDPVTHARRIVTAACDLELGFD